MRGNRRVCQQKARISRENPRVGAITADSPAASATSTTLSAPHDLARARARARARDGVSRFLSRKRNLWELVPLSAPPDVQKTTCRPIADDENKALGAQSEWSQRLKPEVSGHTSSHHPFDITDLKETRPLPRNPPPVPQIDFSWQKNEKLIACPGISSSTTPKTRYTPQAMGWQHGIRVLGGAKSRRTPRARVKSTHANVFPADRGSNPDALGCPVFCPEPRSFCTPPANQEDPPPAPADGGPSTSRNKKSDYAESPYTANVIAMRAASLTWPR